MAQVFFLTIAFYLAYRLVFDLIVPIYRTTRHMKRQFNNMQNMRDSTGAGQEQNNFNTKADPSKPSQKVGEYIDFEEVK